MRWVLVAAGAYNILWVIGLGRCRQAQRGPVQPWAPHDAKSMGVMMQAIKHSGDLLPEHDPAAESALAHVAGILILIAVAVWIFVCVASGRGGAVHCLFLFM